ncbi:tRNA-dependent cyclodipeptide synthase [Xenorhabdus griffiniae]|uniref:tRNA-dependent cyclodipeptide synthase n=1 Tax=Xenorhabdus griffiniae TaxID=351672 RepID=UPI002359D1D8|nr:tRNA-dependent cyclodipeptide synthase [Xenorhabdus griffiniae]MDC9607173.1 tRNA-dependent cyclodipeptide synthase [Xenorhabdus griffiniae]
MSELLIKDPELNIKPERYRTKTAFVFPERKRNSFEYEDECFLGVSLENKNFNSERFISMIEWVNRRFSKCKILIGDSIHRITLETIYGYQPDEAFSKAIIIGKEFINKAETQLMDVNYRTEFSFITCSEIQSTKLYKNYNIKLVDFFSSSKNFKESIESFGKKYHKNKWDGLSEYEKKYRLNKSSQYFLEEFSIFACLVKNGSKVMVYPGTFSSLAEIAEGKHKGIIQELEDLTVVSLNIKRR